MRRLPPLLITFLCTIAISSAVRGADVASFRADLEAIAKSPSRVIASPGYYAAADYVEREIAKLPNVELKRHEFPVMVPVTQSARLEIAGGRAEPVYPFWPAQVRVCSTPAEGIAGRLVYAGECKYEQIRPASIKGQIAVIEASAGERWQETFYAGARAAIILGTATTTWADLQDQELRIPINLPRFYVPPGKLADELRGGSISQATLKANVRWERKLARNLYALVKPPARTPNGWTLSQPPAAFMFSVPIESSSLVPDLAPGAGQAAQTAAGLALLRDVAAHPWNRPVMVFFSGGDTIQHLGTRNMLLALAESPIVWRDELQDVESQIATANHDLNRARELSANPENLSVRDDRDLIDRIAQIVETDLAEQQDRLFRLRGESGSSDEIAQLESRQISLNRLKAAFEQSPKQLANDSMRDGAREYLNRTRSRLTDLLQQYTARRDELNTRIALYEWLADAIGRTKDPGRKQTDARLIDLLVGLDLSDRGTRVGPMFWGFFQRASGMGQIQEFAAWFQKRATQFPAIDFEPLSQVRAPATYLAGPLTVPTELAQAFSTPGLSMMTLNDLRLRRDTPNDTIENLNVERIVPQVSAVRDLFATATSDPKFRGPAEVKRQETGIAGQVVSYSGGKPVPDLPREGFLATCNYLSDKLKDRKIPQLAILRRTVGVRRNEIRDCDAEGFYRFEGLPRLRADKQEGAALLQNDMEVLAVSVYRVDPASGAITATTDLGSQAGDIKWSVDIKLDTKPLRSVVFNCEEFSLLGLYDPRYLQSLGEIIPLDARRNAEPQRYGMMLGDQMLAGFVEPGSKSSLLIRYGKIGNRLVLLNARKEGRDADGYSAAELSALGPLSLVTSRDFYELDDRRLKDYARAGVSSALVDSLHADAGAQLAASDEAMQKDDGVSLVRNSTGAWANEARVYDAAQAMARDVIRAAIFLLILCVPFSFCMERLLIGTPSVYKQIGGARAIFAVMTLALVSFHPAFKISASPLIIILAFAILLMSCLVIFVIYGKFDTELKRIRSGRGTAGGATFANAGVMMSAVLLGIANMRKRKFRTLLTSITIVLITFAVLCFTSTAHYVGTMTIPTGLPTSHPGVMLRQRGFRPMPEILAHQVRSVLADPALKLPATDVVERWWAVSVSEPKEQYNLVSAKKTLAIPAILGLSRGESRLSRIAETIGADKFARLENGEEKIVYLSSETAKALDVREGDSIRIGGIDVAVAGIYDEKAFDENVKTLSGEPIAPLRYSAGQVDANGKPIDDNAAESMEVEAGTESGSAYEHLASSQFAIVPASLCKMLEHAELRSVEFRLDDEDQTRRVSEALARRFSLAMYAGYDDGVRMVSASNLSSVSGASQVAIPLAIAGLIIFNTMMGSIAERKREIHVYTSLGLAPLHVGALFVAEAMTYGLVGTVFGYIIGQGAGTAMLKLGWLGSATLNYSGTSAMITMGLILGIVFLSALVPARLASKIAAPSIDRTWKVPEPEDDQITAVLPFTINRTAAEGALAYIAEFFDAHREGSIGKFSAGPVETFRAAGLFTTETTEITEKKTRKGVTGEGTRVPGVQNLRDFSVSSESSVVNPTAPTDTGTRGLRCDIWLTPFDLGVRQHLELLIHPGEFPEIYEVEVVLKRLAGDDGSWHRLNRTFLTELRKQFLQWRSLAPARMMEYVEESKQLFQPQVA